MSSKQPILSIVIPTYNRSSKVVDMVQAVLAAELNIELVVIDNCSQTKHVEQLKTIVNPNFKLILREKNIGGLANPLDALNYGSGLFTMLCLDKDHVKAQHLGPLLDLLANSPDLVYGQCALNATQTTENKWLAQGFKTLLSNGYDCHHPSGFFARTETLVATGIVAHLLLHSRLFPFNIDIIKAHLTMEGKGCYFNSSLVQTETLSESAKKCSHTYFGENIWFLPNNIFKRMITFIEDTQTLGLNKGQEQKIIKKLYLSNLCGATLRYREIMGNASLCAHHGLESKKIGIAGLIGAMYRFAQSFLKSTIQCSKISRTFIILYKGIRWSILLILNR